MNVASRARRSLFRSVVAVVGGLAATVVLTIGTDMWLESAGVLPKGPLLDTGPLLLATAYRTVYGVIGGYTAARLAPRHPLRHAMALGVVALGLNIAGAAAMWGRSSAWYPLTLTALALPSAWLGGRIAERRPSAAGEVTS